MKNVLRRRFLQMAGLAAAAPALSRLASAETYPARPVRVVLPYAPAGVTDVVGRLIALKLTDQLGKQTASLRSEIDHFLADIQAA